MRQGQPLDRLDVYFAFRYAFLAHPDVRIASGWEDDREVLRIEIRWHEGMRRVDGVVFIRLEDMRRGELAEVVYLAERYRREFEAKIAEQRATPVSIYGTGRVR